MGIIPKGLLSETLFFDGILLKTEKHENKIKPPGLMY